MKDIIVQSIDHPVVDAALVTDYILSVQKESGEIPWSNGGETDNWDHVENAMALTIAGHYDAARSAFQWSAKKQMEDGSWWSCYRNGEPGEKSHKDPNMSSYVAVGLLHYFIATKDLAFLTEMWSVVCRAMDFVLELQGEEGEISWAKRSDGSIDRKSLLTGSSSIYLSLTCALGIASVLGLRKPEWERARDLLGKAISSKPHLFDQTKSRFAMDWYYPVLSGVLRGEDADRRIKKMWDQFVIPDWGVKCVSDQPWVTIGETAELCISLAAAGKTALSKTVLCWISDNLYEDGAFWTGVTVPDKIIYTDEKTTWSGASVILAADMIYALSPASDFFRHGFLDAFSDRHLLRVK
jgi:hypothetical protein